MKLIIAGSRTLDLYPSFLKSIIGSCEDSGMKIVTEIVSGGAKGIDSLAEYYCTENWHCYNYWKPFPFKKFPADWDQFGKAAGHIRNKEMADYSDALLLIWDGESRGSKNMKETMIKQGKPVYEVILKAHNA